MCVFDADIYSNERVAFKIISNISTKTAEIAFIMFYLTMNALVYSTS